MQQNWVGDEFVVNPVRKGKTYSLKYYIKDNGFQEYLNRIGEYDGDEIARQEVVNDEKIEYFDRTDQ